MSAVGQFRDVVEVAEKDPQLCETLKKVLKLTRGWEIARDHVRTAVASDNQMRIWTEPPTSAASTPAEGGGLLYKCHLGSVDLNHPVGDSPLLSPFGFNLTSCSLPHGRIKYCS